MIHVIATIRAREGQLPALIDEFRKIVPGTVVKEGCLEYSLAVHLPSGLPGQPVFNDSELIIVEKWIDVSYLKAHIADPVYRDWYAKVWKIVEGASMQLFEAVD